MIARDQAVEYFDSIGKNHEFLAPTGTDAISFNQVGIPASGLLTGQDCCKTQEEVKEHSGIGVGGVLGLVIYIVLSPVTWFLIPSDVGKMFKADGRPAPFTGWTGLWLLLPIIGMFVWFIKIQGALNRYWESKAGASAVPAVV